MKTLKIVASILVFSCLVQGMPAALANDLIDQEVIQDEEFLKMQGGEEILESTANIQTRTSSLLSDCSYGLTLTTSGLASYHARIYSSKASKVYVASVIQRSSNGADWTDVSGTFLSQTVNGTYAYISDSRYVSKGYGYRQQVTLIAYDASGNQEKEVINTGFYWYN